MHALIVTSHPKTTSLSHAVSRCLAEGLHVAGHGADFADLAQEGFDPRFTAADHDHFEGSGPLPEGIAAEQARIDAADALVLVWPVYWWSFPALMKGWIDRVFTPGWAYGTSDDPGQNKLLGRLPVHLIGIGVSSAGVYQRRGYRSAMETQINRGIFDYCGAPVQGSHLLLPDATSGKVDIEAARGIGLRLFDM